MSNNENRQMKSWVAWLLFFVTVGIVFLLGMLAASITQRRAEVASILNNKKVNITGIESRNEIFAQNYPREYESWIRTADTTFQSEFNGSSVADVLEQRPEMPSRRITEHPGAICMPSRISTTRYVREHRSLRTKDRSRQPAGPVKARTFPV
jgi:hypothetical protein